DLSILLVRCRCMEEPCGTFPDACCDHFHHRCFWADHLRDWRCSLVYIRWAYRARHLIGSQAFSRRQNRPRTRRSPVIWIGLQKSLATSRGLVIKGESSWPISFVKARTPF